MKHCSLGVLVVAAAMAAGCGSDEVEPPSTPAAETTRTSESNQKPAEWPTSADPILIAGRAVWLENCENCHGIGKAESPRFMDHEAWAPRLTKGEANLINSAINGFEGETEAGMPPRGGNKKLTDEDVTVATKYMIHFSTNP